MKNARFKIVHDMPVTMATEKKRNILVIALVIVVIVLASVLSLIWFNNWENNRQQTAYTVGYKQGAAAAILEIIQRSQGCKTVPLFANNVTYTYVDVGCLQKTVS